MGDSKANNVVGKPPRSGVAPSLVIGLFIALSAMGLPMIGIAVNLYLGALVLLVGFILLSYGFWRWETAARWGTGTRVSTIWGMGLVYFSLIGFQIYSQYQRGHRPTTVSPSLNSVSSPPKQDSTTHTPEVNTRPEHASKGQSLAESTLILAANIRKLSQDWVMEQSKINNANDVTDQQRKSMSEVWSHKIMAEYDERFKANARIAHDKLLDSLPPYTVSVGANAPVQRHLAVMDCRVRQSRGYELAMVCCQAAGVRSARRWIEVLASPGRTAAR
jgi:hypothetical protein